VGNKARELCELAAIDADTEIERAISKYGINNPHQQSRLATRR